VDPGAAGDDGSKLPIALTVAAHRATPTRATLSCSAPGAATGTEVIRAIRFVAFQTTALSLGQGPSYTNYGNQSATSHVYQGHVAGPVHLTNADQTYAVAHLTLPAGSWTVTVSATVAGTAFGYGQVLCEIVTGHDYDQTREAVLYPTYYDDMVNVSQEVVRTVNSPWTATFQCSDHGSTPHDVLKDVRITAYRAQLVVNQDLGVDDTFPLEPATVRPLVMAGWNDGPVAVPSSAGFHTVADQVLPPGNWVVVAKGWVDNTGVDQQSVTCRLGPVGTGDDIDLVLSKAGIIDSLYPFSLMWHGTITAGSHVRLACRAPGGSVTANWVKLVAYRAGTLSIQKIR
jgi:hypothetical protein